MSNDAAQESRGETYPRRLHELEQRFSSLLNQLSDSPQKEAVSVLHGMMQELWRHVGRSSGPPDGGGLDLAAISELYRHAPKMEGQARNTPLPAGTAAPDFALSDARGRIVRLEDYRGDATVLAFYPLDWSPGCSQQLDLYQQELDEFERRHVRVLGISVDSLYSHGAWAAVRGVTFPLLADFQPKGDVARRYRVYRDEDGFSERALYVVDGEGTIRYSHVSPFLQHVPDIYELFAALDAIGSATAAHR
jgi:peroxiredoxin